jgi:pimeloyl-ACP methyl ester carboxylesterase
MSPLDALYVVEYPGYGLRDGKSTKESMNAAVAEAYGVLRQRFSCPVNVLGESIGSGPASSLASSVRPPDAFVFVVPFDTLASVAGDHLPFLPVRLVLRDNWDNIEALKGYTGPVTIYGAEDDQVIPVQHARHLAATLRDARFVLIHGGHNDWSASEDVRIEIPAQEGKP